MAAVATIKRAIPTTTGFRNFAFYTLHFDFPLPPLYKCRENSTNRLLFMQNKPNFRKTKMNLNSVKTTVYENETAFRVRKNKPNSNPIQAKTNPIQTQFKPKQTQNKPNQSQFKPNFPPILKISFFPPVNLRKIFVPFLFSFLCHSILPFN